jgi:AraC family transcriptional regulator
MAREDSSSPPWRTATLFALPRLSCRLAYYRRGLRQPPHSHALPVISTVLTGSVHEEVGGSEEEAQSGCLSVKPPDVRHSDVFGAQGALILSVAIDDPALWAEAVPDERWRWMRLERGHQAEIVSLFRGPTSADAVFELLALAARQQRRRGTPPAWLVRVAERLADDPDAALGAVAADENIHPVYLSRAFRRWFATSPSAFRLQRKSSIAASMLLAGGSAASDVAHKAGFADQSHMTRSIRNATGHSPTRLIALVGP